MRELNLVRYAVMSFTRLPQPEISDFSEELQGHSARYLTLIGWLVGVISAIVYAMFSVAVDSNVAIAFALLAAIMATGAFHEDGLADSVDGLAGGWTVEKRLKIMKDSRVGSFGVIALVFVILLKFTLLVSIPEYLVVIALLGGAVFSRLAANLAIWFLDYVSLNESSKGISIVKHFDEKDLIVSALVSAPIMLILPWPIVVVTLSLVPGYFFAVWSRHKIGGCTGDVLGGIQQVCEVGFYLALLAVL